MATPTRYDAFGFVVPPERKAQAMKHLRHMVPGIATGEAMCAVDAIASAIERDQPYDIHRMVLDKQLPVDLCGVFRLWAVLMSAAPDEPADRPAVRVRTHVAMLPRPDDAPPENAADAAVRRMLADLRDE